MAGWDVGSPSRDRVLMLEQVPGSFFSGVGDPPGHVLVRIVAHGLVMLRNIR